MADVVLPSAQWAEEDGTMTNLEGRVLLRKRVFPPPPAVKTDLELLSELAGRLGAASHFPTSAPREVFDELRRATAGGVADYAGISYERIEREDGVFWPCPSADHPGTARMFSERFPTPTGRARFHAVTHKAPAEERSAAFPLFLTTGRLLSQYQSGTQTRRIERLTEPVPEPTVDVHPRTAARLGITAGQLVDVTTARGTARFRARLSPGLREDTIFLPFHWSGAQSANRLTNPALDPMSRMPEFKVCAASLTSLVNEGEQVR
jgi:assimilatory nitrate reductase catalytic subunit